MVLEGVPGGSGSVRYGRVLVFCRAAYYIIKKVIRFGTKSQHTGRGGALVRRASHSQRAALHETPSVSGPCGRGPRATSGTVRGRVLGRSAGARSAGRRALAEVALPRPLPSLSIHGPPPAGRRAPPARGAAGRRCAAARVAVDRRRALRDPRALRAHRAQATGKRRMLASSRSLDAVLAGSRRRACISIPHTPTQPPQDEPWPRRRPAARGGRGRYVCISSLSVLYRLRTVCLLAACGSLRRRAVERRSRPTRRSSVDRERGHWRSPSRSHTSASKAEGLAPVASACDHPRGGRRVRHKAGPPRGARAPVRCRRGR
jgi:hypothetical protein